MSKHAFLSPSGAPAWSRCLAKPHMEAGLPDTSGADAGEGTAAHTLRAMCLDSGQDARAYLGRILDGFEVTEEMADAVQRSLDVARTLPGQRLVEVELDIEPITGEIGAKGTSDTVYLDYATGTIIVEDYKHGRGVPVAAEENEQLVIYTGATFLQFEMLADWQRVTMRISQPRINNDSEWSISVDELRQRLAALTAKAQQILAGDKDSLPATPSEKACRFCKAKATCPALLTQVMDDFQSVPAPKEAESDQLAQVLGQVDLIESWCKAVRGEAERRLLAGEHVPGFKLVEGRRGARRWASETEVESVLKGMRLKHEQIYDYSLISPTAAEKLAKAGELGPRQWTTLQSLITQSEGKPSVAPDCDKRPALQQVADDFAVVT